MMLAQRALALVAEVQERLRLVGRDERQGTIHTRPGRRAGGRGEGQSGTERGHRAYPLLLWGDAGSVHTDPPGGSDVSRTPQPCVAVILASCTWPTPGPCVRRAGAFTRQDSREHARRAQRAHVSYGLHAKRSWGTTQTERRKSCQNACRRRTGRQAGDKARILLQ